MPDFSGIARERAALATIADAIVAASVGKGLRIAVACPASQLAVVDYLAQALHARGRASRLTASPRPAAAGDLPPGQQASRLTLVVITSGGVTDLDRGVLRVSISVISTSTGAWHRDEVSHQESGEAESPPPGGTRDIMLECREAYGPRMRYIAPFLSAGTRP